MSQTRSRHRVADASAAPKANSLLLRKALALVLLPALAACASVSPATNQVSIAIRSDARPIAPDEARGLPPKELANILLASPHPDAVEATVGPEGMEAPIPPTGPASIRMKLYLDPALSAHRGFCERIIATVMMAPAGRLAGGSVAAARPKSVTTEIAYKWIGPKKNFAACRTPRSSFFTPNAELTNALETVRMLVAAREEARSHRRLPFALTVDDQMAREMNEFRKRGLLQIPPEEVITDARAALASLDIGMVSFAGPSHRASSDVFRDGDRSLQGRPLDGRIVFLGGVWTAGLIVEGGRVTLIRLKRAIPPPF